MTNPAQFYQKCGRRCGVLMDLMDALEIARDAVTCGPIRWGCGEGRANMKLLEEMGIRLVTKTAAGRHGHVLKRGARPVGTVYFGAPLQRHAGIYILGVQTKPVTSCATKGPT